MKNKAQHLTTWTSLKLAVLATVVSLVPEIAAAYDMGYIICNGAILLRGPVATGVATIAVSALGVGAMFGKVSWTLAILVGVGTAALFGAPSVIAYMAGGLGFAGC